MEKNIRIILSQNCNLRCSYCIQKDFEYTDTIVKFSAIRRLIDYYFRYRVNEGERLTISFSGGEPLLQFGLIKKTVSYINSKFPKKSVIFKIITNGTLLNREIITFLRRYKFLIFLSLDGEKLSHDLNRYFLDKKGSFYSAVKYLPYLVGYDKFGINMVITSHNAENLSRNVKFFIKKRIKIIKFFIDLYPYSKNSAKKRWTKQSLQTLKTQYHKVANYYLYLKRRGKKILFPNLFETNIQKAVCSDNFRNGLTLLPNGDVHICFACYFRSFKSLSKKFIVGNAMDSNFSKKLLNLNSRLEEINNQTLVDNKSIKELSQELYKICFFFASEGDQDSIDYLKFQTRLFKSLRDLRLSYREKMTENGIETTIS